MAYRCVKTFNSSPELVRRRTNLESLPREIRQYLERYGDRLSRSTQRAKWITSPDDRPERKGQTLATRDHDVIMPWAEERGAQPVTVQRKAGSIRTLRFDFPGYGGQSLQPISWNDWLRVFDDRKLAFIYQEQTRDGRQSNFWRLDSPDREEG
jgi:hypothetical protein